MSVQAALILAVALPALGLALYPLVRMGRGRGEAAAPAAPGPDPRRELQEEKLVVYRALRELDLDREVGHIGKEDHRGLRDRYETRAAEIVAGLDAMGSATDGAAPAEPGEPAPAEAVPARRRNAVLLAGGAVALLAAGVIIGVNAGRSSAPPPAPPRSALPPLGPGAAAGPGPGAAAPMSPEAMAGALRSARQSLNERKYQEALAGYQAVLGQDPANPDALTHMALIVAIGGHVDSALESFAKVLAAHPDYALVYFYRGQVLYRAKRDVAGAIRDWERFLELVPRGEKRERIVALLGEARQGQLPR